ncbi:hypothetical protein E2542_SST11468 [Spatholobus suberectus]|nr:hypothetical protein E2542_SST11468 [Spatholobus suberectus]
MSGYSHEIEEISEGGYAGDSNDNDEDSENEKKQARRRKMGSCFGKNTGKVVLHPFTKAKKQLGRIKSKKALVPSSQSRNASKKIVGDEGTRRGSGWSKKSCCSRPQVLETPENESPPSDPNDPRFTPQMLQTWMDNNDFYSKESNPHQD